jgi:hypothetical protein
MRRSFAPLVVAFLLIHASPVAAEGHLPGDTITNGKGTTLQPNVCNSIFAIDQTLAPACKKTRVVLQTAVVGEPRRLNFGSTMQWTERWTIDRCGAQAIYLIHFDFRRAQGTFKIEPPKS